jgi:DNA polymerase
MLREMGLAPIWRLRSAAVAEHERVESNRAEETPVVEPHAVEHAVPARKPEPAPSPFVEAFTHATTTPDRAQVLPRTTGPDARSQDQQDRANRIAGLDWDKLEDDIRNCSACGLCVQRKQAVPGVGDRNADWMFVGEGPGAEEDRQGEPFVGPAGRLLDAMLNSIGLKRGAGVYIANAVKCRPPMNRTPDGTEIDTCLPYLERQIALVQPRILVALGRPAVQALLGTDVRINAARGKTFTHKDIPVVVTYHPAYLLRNQADKAKVWADLCFARRILDGQGGD